MNPEEYYDYEASRLKKMIEHKKKYLATIDPSQTRYKLLLSEIEFLDQEILPIVLSKNLFINEINRFVDQKFKELAEHKNPQIFNGLLFYFQLKEPEINKVPMAAFYSNLPKGTVSIDAGPRVYTSIDQFVHITPVEM